MVRVMFFNKSILIESTSLPIHYFNKILILKLHVPAKFNEFIILTGYKIPTIKKIHDICFYVFSYRSHSIKNTAVKCKNNENKKVF